ncbi:MAG: hypothetical protein VKK59_07000 [Vampirovibrionales bacterium]|nr:hypothetical protein [Vampirovibrionales bacterium]
MSNPTPDNLKNQDIQAMREAFNADPVGFIKGIIAQEAEGHLAKLSETLSESAQIQQTVLALRKHNAEFAQFEPYILQEVAHLVQNDPDGVLEPWPVLFDKAMANFKANFQKIMAEKAPEASKSQQAGLQMEPAGNRDGASRPQHFTRNQIAQMSLDEYLRNEPAIGEALKAGRIA